MFHVYVCCMLLSFVSVNLVFKYLIGLGYARETVLWKKWAQKPLLKYIILCACAGLFFWLV